MTTAVVEYETRWANQSRNGGANPTPPYKFLRVVGGCNDRVY